MIDNDFATNFHKVPDSHYLKGEPYWFPFYNMWSQCRKPYNPIVFCQHAWGMQENKIKSLESQLEKLKKESAAKDALLADAKKIVESYEVMCKGLSDPFKCINLMTSDNSVLNLNIITTKCDDFLKKLN